MLPAPMPDARDRLDDHLTTAAWDAVVGRASGTREWVEEIASIVPTVEREHKRRQDRLREVRDEMEDPATRFERLSGIRLPPLDDA